MIPAGLKIEVLTDDLYKLLIGKLACSECIHHDRSRLCNTDRIRKLDLTFVCQTCCNDILCYISCCICCGTVYLCAVLTGECAAAVSCISTVSINDDLTTCQSAVTVRSADYETSCRIDDKYLVSSSTISAGKDRIE